MKKWFTLLILSLLTVFLLTPFTTKAEDSNKVYQQSYEEYRKAADDFSSARSQYIAYHSLWAQTDLISAAKTMFTKRANVVSVHLSLLEQKIQSTTGYSGAEKTQAVKLLLGDIESLKKHTNDVSRAVSIDELTGLNENSKEFFKKSRIKSNVGILQFRTSYGFQLVGLVEGINNEAKTKVEKLKKEGKDVVLLQSWTGEIDKRAGKIKENLSWAKSQLLSENPLEGDVNKARAGQILDETDQMIKQTNNYFDEIVSGMENVRSK